MSDERVGQERNSSHIHELSETPFGVGRNDSERKSTEPEGVTEAEQENKTAMPVESPEPGEQAELKAEPKTEPEPEPLPEPDEPITMEAAMAEMGGPGRGFAGSFKSLRPGDVVDGVVVHIDKDGVLVDVGTKSEGHIKPTELSSNSSLSPEEVVAVGDRIKVYVVQPESQDGGPVLSKKRADFENAWDRVEKAFADGEVMKAMVMDRVKGGLVVDLGIRGFVPASHVQSGKLKNLEKFVGQSLQFKVIEVDRERRKVVLSNRLAVEEERTAMRGETLGSLAEGQIRDGIVRRLTDYGAFVDLGGVDGLLHVSEMSWTRINHPSEVVKPGQKIQVAVLKLNLAQGRVSLGLRQILPDPWENVKRLYRVGDIIKGTVTRVVPFGAFVQVDGGVEGIIPNSELATRRVNSPEEVVTSGQEVEIKVIDVRPDERRLTLSLRQLQVQKERERDAAELREYSQGRPDSRTTIGDLIGEQLNGFSFAEEKPAKKPKARSAKREAIEEAEALADLEEEILDEEIAEAEPEVEVESVAVVEETPVALIEEQISAEAAVGKAEPVAVEEAPAPAKPKRASRSKKTAAEKKAAEPVAEDVPVEEPAEA